ncbi:MAG: PorT family protein [Bryobacterales bacterium]|nr:PorT family protein [Bryobacterales bacterium]
MKRLLPAVLLCVPALTAQPISLGVKLGAPLNDAFDTLADPGELLRSETKRYTIGPTFELHLPFRLSVEVDALYKQANFSSFQQLADSVVTASSSVNSWEVPVLLKYRFSGGLIRPFVDTGVSFNTLTGVSEIRDFFRVPGIRERVGDQPVFEDSYRSGFVLGGGIEVRVPFLRISPEIRYTRWGFKNYRDIRGLLDSSDDQTEFLLGITF